MLKFEELYSWVKNLPIIDWHNHLDLDMLAADKPLGSLYDVWVKTDPYKHRAMRICGEPEEFVTGAPGASSANQSPGTTGVPPVGVSNTGTTGVSPVGVSNTGTTGVSPVGVSNTGTTGVPPVGVSNTGTTGVSPVGVSNTGTTGVSPVGERLTSSPRNGQDARCPSRRCSDDDTVNGQDARCPSERWLGDPKWAAWMRTLPKLVGNPIFAWAKMELEFLGLDPEPYLHGRGENVSLGAWTPSKLLRAFGVEMICPCLGAEQLGQRASRPLPSWGQPSLGQRASCPLPVSSPGQRLLGQRASRPLEPLERGRSCANAPGVPPGAPVGIPPAAVVGASRPLVWTAPRMWLSPDVEEATAAHFSHSLKSEEFHHRNLPHIGQNGTLAFVTFRLGDSLPAEKLAELDELRRQARQPGANSDLTHEEIDKIDDWLDAGFGSCVLADEKCRQIVEDALAYFDTGTTGVPPVGVSNTGTTGVPPVGVSNTGTTGVPPVGGVNTGTTGVSPVGGTNTGTTGVPPVGERLTSSPRNGQDARCPSRRCSDDSVSPVGVRSRYRLHAYVVMPNHVHVLFELFDAADLANVIHSWKSYTAKAINRELGLTGTLWREEYYDRLIRDGRHYQNVISYLRKNEHAARVIANRNGRSPTGTTGVPPVGGSNTGTTGVSPVGERLTSSFSNGQDARCPSRRCPDDDTVNGQDARCPSRRCSGDGAVATVPSLRMNAGERISHDTLACFEAAGCRVVDISVDDSAKLETEFDSLAAVAAFAAVHGWTMLLHLGALRETSARLRAVAGPAGGFAGMRAPVDPAAVARFLNRLESINACDRQDPGTTGVSPVGERLTSSPRNGQDARCPSRRCSDDGAGNGQDARCPSRRCSGDDTVNGQDARCPSGRCSGDERFSSALPRTILLSLNPLAHAQLAVLAGSFNGDGQPGKVQLGPAWWWCDHEEGIRDVLEKNAAYGVLSTFVGMTTDSRSLLSFVRHDYFRRLLCRWVAEKIASGAFPDDAALVRPLLENVCYKNSKEMMK